MINPGKMRSLLGITRYPLCIIAAALAFEGYWISLHKFDISDSRVFFAALVVGSSMAFANVHNDLVDFKTDVINYPNRPLPSGKITIKEAKILILFLFFVSVFLSLLVGIAMFILTSCLLMIAALYNLWAKKIPVLGNVIVALLCALTIIPGYIIVAKGVLPIVPLLSSFFFILAREFVGTVGDEAGDREGGRRTINMILGKKKVLLMSLALSLFSIISSVSALFICELHNPSLYLILLMVLSVLPLSIAIVSIWKNQNPLNIRNVSYKMRIVFFTNFILFLFLV